MSAEFAAAMRRIVTGNDAIARSTVIVDGTASASFAGLHEIWHERIDEPMDPTDRTDRGPDSVLLSPPDRAVAVRWFVVEPVPPGVPHEQLVKSATRSFDRLGAADSLKSQDRDPTMHQTDTLDIVCLVSGSASLVLDLTETVMTPGQVVIQRGTTHTWRAHGGPALFLAVLVDRQVVRPDNLRGKSV